MVHENAGLSSNSSDNMDISPNNDLQLATGDDSDSDLEQMDVLNDYVPLAQNPSDGNPLYISLTDSDEDENDDDNDDMPVSESNVSGAVGGNISDATSLSSTYIQEVWNTPPPNPIGIELDETKILLIKQSMANIELPPNVIPEWARNIVEEEWKSHLLEKLNK
ncbi:hypothetical protein ABEB36_004079 [Hypothenemus hampei]|uniref:Male-enhanced antigen 1 n=1 Tax=Hypothenemus hampei TaxID=57062 RepID=A0ABD1F2N7_HYPHA